MGVFPVALLQCLNHDLIQYGDLGNQIYPGATPREAAVVSLRRSFTRKWVSDQTDAADNACLTKFLYTNERCKNWTLDKDKLQTWDEELLGEFKNSVDRFFHPGGVPLVGHFGSLLAVARVGPGASLGARGGDFYTKLFSSPLTSTRRALYDEYRRYVRNYPEWCIAEQIRSTAFGECRIVKGNRLSFVAKYTHISRSICTEPSLNMFYQLGLECVLRERLRSYFGIDLSNQQFKNQDLARRGSLGEGYSTLDLESASDSISTKMCGWALPSWLNSLLDLLRSPTTEIRGREHVLHMVSTMGNGSTFPLQTILFSCMVEAAARMAEVHLRFPRGNDQGTFGVYGDDIICPSACTRYVYRLLDLLGFSVNTSKSFVEGPFRESCGADFYLGINIRGVYVDYLECKQDYYSVINQLNLFSTRTGIRLPTTQRWLLSRVPFNAVPRWEDDSSGIKVPGSLLRNPPLCVHTGSILYTPYVVQNQKIRILDSAVFAPKSLKSRMYNPSGLLISILQGSIRSSSIAARLSRNRWRTKLRVAPYWDATPNVHPLSGWFCWQRWETAVYLNL